MLAGPRTTFAFICQLTLAKKLYFVGLTACLSPAYFVGSPPTKQAVHGRAKANGRQRSEEVLKEEFKIFVYKYKIFY